MQVLSEALKLFGAEIQALKSSEAIKLIEKNMDSIEAFIFNSSTHWFAIRKIDNIWFNLNSTNVFPGPEIISDFYLSAFIQGTEDIGYTNFLVKKLPPLSDIKSGTYSNLQNYQRLVSIEDIIKAKESKKQKNVSNKESEDSEAKKEEEKKFNAFSGKGVMISDESSIKNNQSQHFEDDEMKQAYQLSLDEYVKDLMNYLPEEPEKNDPDAYNINFKYDNQTFSRRFSSNNTIHVKLYNINNYHLFLIGPKQLR